MQQQQPESLKGKRRMILKLAIGIALGAVAGFAWYRFVGCSTGTCPLTSRWYVTTIYGAVLGGIAASGR